VRLFIAIEIEDEAKHAIALEQKRLADAMSVSRLRWTRPEQMHMTLVFLGEIHEEHVEPIVSSLKSLEQEVLVQPFDMTFGGTGVFPPRGAPRVLWLGVTGGAESASAVHTEVMRRLGDLDRHDAERPFHPHVTLARWPKSRLNARVEAGPGDRRRAIEAIQSKGRARTVGRTHVGSITLFRSRSSPQTGAGPAYTPLARVTLK
jgi:2'-5' RNA ligase